MSMPESAGIPAFDAASILDRLRTLREADAPTHGGHVLSYVYDSGSAALDELAAEAIRIMQPVNGLDPTAFPSVAAMERELVGFAREVFAADAEGREEIAGTVTTGGTESCLLAVKAARDSWRGDGAPRLLAPSTVHAAFHKAAEYFGLALDLVPVEPDGSLRADRLIERLGDDVALVVVSAPSYPFAALDPVAEVAAACAGRGIACHVDACIGGWVLPWWGGEVPAWDFRVPGVTSLSADLHKFGYAPKGASVLLHRGRDRQRAQYFATTSWPGYPVVNPTMLGSRSAGPLAAAWSIIQALGADGLADLARSCRRATDALIELVGSIEGLRVVGSPTGPLFAVAADDARLPERQVDPHHWADQVRVHGWLLQLQPGFVQADGTRLPHTTHLTVTPVTERVLPELGAALVRAAEEVRGVPAVDPEQVLRSLPPELSAGVLGSEGAAQLDSATAWQLLNAIGLAPGSDGTALPERMAPFLALVEALPHPLTERLLTELLARLVEP